MMELLAIFSMILMFIFFGISVEMISRYENRGRKIFLFAAISFIFLTVQQFFFSVWIFESIFYGIPLFSFPLELLGIITCFSLSLLGMAMLGKVEP